MKPILEIQGVSKKFILNHQGSPYLSFRDKFSNFRRNEKEEFWALRDITFDVQRGESLGIIGRNGAGKSTLLKTLSRITPPTQGRVISRGRIASLLEVGTGFHQELTGRENIFMNGSILGMKRSEIKLKFDEIVDFSGTDKFLDTQLKHFSSGMQLRLAFAVAAHLEPEILIIDEVLAVGDAEFQKKCLGKMSEVVGQGRTILFVSHNLSAVQNLCEKAILLKDGCIYTSGAVTPVLDNYASISHISIQDKISFSGIDRKAYHGALQFASLSFEKSVVKFGEALNFTLEVIAKESTAVSDVTIAVAINDKHSICVIHCSSEFLGQRLGFNNTRTTYEFTIHHQLRPGSYTLTVFLKARGVIQDWLTDVASFIIEDGNPYGFPNTESIHGMVFPTYSILQK
jgi:lipopolysaccharide transport system ATP-binding protein